MIKKLLNNKAFWDHHVLEIATSMLELSGPGVTFDDSVKEAELCIQRMRSDMSTIIERTENAK